MNKCTVEGCENKHKAKGYCEKHYAQFRKYGKILERTTFTPNDYVIQMGIFIGNETEPSDIVIMNCYNIKNEKSCEFIFDLEDLDKVKKYKWHLSVYGYINSKINKKRIDLHNFLFDNVICGKGFKRDHINRNPLDNRKRNLRIVTDSLNVVNRNISKNNTIGFKGIYIKKNKNNIKYVAKIVFNKKDIYLGTYNTTEEAHEVYKNKCRELHGEYYLDNV